MKMVNFTINKSPHSIICFNNLTIHCQKRKERGDNIDHSILQSKWRQKGKRKKSKKKKRGNIQYWEANTSVPTNTCEMQNGCETTIKPGSSCFFLKRFAAASFHSKTGVGYGDEHNRRRRRRLWFQRRMDRIWMVGRCALNYREYWGAKLPDSSID